jgi:hypothetical protein
MRLISIFVSAITGKPTWLQSSFPKMVLDRAVARLVATEMLLFNFAQSEGLYGLLCDLANETLPRLDRANIKVCLVF